MERYPAGSLLPSEHEICRQYRITRTTTRKALDELVREGFVKKEQGRGSRVVERRKSLGLLTVKGFSEAVGKGVRTRFLRQPHLTEWPEDLPFSPEAVELDTPCIFFERLRYVGDNPVMHESNWFSGKPLKGFTGIDFIDGSFFKTLSQRYLIEITTSEQEIRALAADDRRSLLLNIQKGAPILKISIRFSTSEPLLNIYSLLYCDTEKYPIGNYYKH